MKIFRAVFDSAIDTSRKVDLPAGALDCFGNPTEGTPDNHAYQVLYSAELTFRTIGPFPSLKELERKTVEIRIPD